MFIKKKKPSIVMWAFLLYYAWALYEQHRAGLKPNDYHLVISAITIVVIIETYIKDDPVNLIKAFMYVFEVYIYVNFITLLYNVVIGKPKDPTFLAHHWNVMNPYTIVALCIGVLYKKCTGNKKEELHYVRLV